MTVAHDLMFERRADRSRVRRAMTLAGLMGLALALAGSSPAVAARPPKTALLCAVTNPHQHTTYGTLQAAVHAAADGDTIRVTGICAGTTTISKDLNIVGSTRGRNRFATLDAQGAGRVVTITGGVSVTLRRLNIINGSADFGGGVATQFAGAATNNVVVSDSVIRNNHATNGGGIGNAHGLVTLVNTAVRGNSASIDAGGVHNSRFDGTLTLRGSSVVTGNNAGRDGGGIYNDLHGTLTLEDSASVSGNAAGAKGGGIYVSDSVVTLTDSASVHANSANTGGGVFVGAMFGVFDPIGASTVTGNTPDNVCFGAWPGSAGCVS